MSGELVHQTLAEIARLWPEPEGGAGDGWRHWLDREVRERYSAKAQAVFELYPDIPPELAARSLFYARDPHEVLAQIEHERTGIAQQRMRERSHADHIARHAMHERDDDLNLERVKIRVADLGGQQCGEQLRTGQCPGWAPPGRDRCGMHSPPDQPPLVLFYDPTTGALTEETKPEHTP